MTSVETGQRVLSEYQQLRLEQAKGLRAIIGRPLVATQCQLPPNLERDKRFDHEYGILAEDLCARSIAKAQSANDERLLRLIGRPNVLNGFYILTNILKWAPSTYRHYAEAHPEQPASVEQLGQIMHRSAASANMFANLDMPSTQEYEMAFGVWSNYPPMYEDRPFIIGGNTDGELEFTASPLTLQRAKFDAARSQVINERDPAEAKLKRCPALGIVINTVWSEAVDCCVEEPQLWQAGLSLAA